MDNHEWGKRPSADVVSAVSKGPMKDNDYRAILSSIDAALRVIGEEPPDQASEPRIQKDLRKLRETLIRAQRDSLDKNIKRPDSRSPLGVQ